MSDTFTQLETPCVVFVLDIYVLTNSPCCLTALNVCLFLPLYTNSSGSYLFLKQNSATDGCTKPPEASRLKVSRCSDIWWLTSLTALQDNLTLILLDKCPHKYVVLVSLYWSTKAC